MAIVTVPPFPVGNFATDFAATPYIFAAGTPMKVRSAPSLSPSTVQIQAGKVKDIVYIDPATSFKWLDASWEFGKEEADMNVGDVDRLWVLIAGPDNVTPAGWVCFYEEYKTKAPDEVIYVSWCAFTANVPPTTPEVDAAQVQLTKEKAARDAFLKTIGKPAGGGGDSADGSGGGSSSTAKKAAFGAGGFLIAMLILGVIMGSKKK